MPSGSLILLDANSGLVFRCYPWCSCWHSIQLLSNYCKVFAPRVSVFCWAWNCICNDLWNKVLAMCFFNLASTYSVIFSSFIKMVQILFTSKTRLEKLLLTAVDSGPVFGRCAGTLFFNLSPKMPGLIGSFSLKSVKISSRWPGPVRRNSQCSMIVVFVCPHRLHERNRFPLVHFVVHVMPSGHLLVHCDHDHLGPFLCFWWRCCAQAVEVSA